MRGKIFQILISATIALTTFKSSAQGGMKAITLNQKNLPAGIKYEGKLKKGLRWTDKNGGNVVITSETGIHRNEKFAHESDGEDAELFAYHYIVKNNKVTTGWKIYDYISDCPLDITATFTDAAFQITDLNKNGIAEIWILYKTACSGDVSPADMKLIMYENGKKFAMRGTGKALLGIEKGVKQYDGGEYTFDKAFTGAPESFRAFAKKLWNANAI
ncbi:MAG: hypothetical protein EOO45_23115 [Flavobacterium sp.]|nr:MAG: hypothetical protein EOO45_23115 [Flavobacterium sp.]